MQDIPTTWNIHIITPRPGSRALAPDFSYGMNPPTCHLRCSTPKNGVKTGGKMLNTHGELVARRWWRP